MTINGGPLKVAVIAGAVGCVALLLGRTLSWAQDVTQGTASAAYGAGAWVMLAVCAAAAAVAVAAVLVEGARTVARR